MKIIMYFFIIFTIGCNRITDSIIISKTYSYYGLNYDSSHVFQETLGYDSIVINKGLASFTFIRKNMVLTAIKSEFDLIKFGHFFSFNDGGELENYSFQTGGKSLSLKLINGKYQIEGSPFVDTKRLISDSAGFNKYILLFSTFPWQNLNVSFSSDGTHYENILLTKSARMPLLMESTLYFKNDHAPVLIRTDASGLIFSIESIKKNDVFFDEFIF